MSRERIFALVGAAAACCLLPVAALSGCSGTTPGSDVDGGLGAVDAALASSASNLPEAGHALACGNDVLEPGEECDDGNRRGDDGCNARCKLEPRCAEGTLMRSGECFTFIAGETSGEGCGNGIVEEHEQCDDGNHADGDGCGAFCRREPVCGNGQLEREEECDPPGTSQCDADCRWLEIPPKCGDGNIDADEACDDGNLRNGDECDSECRSEAKCGNGIVEAAGAEECEPPGHGDCSDQCRFSEPPECGNGTLESYWISVGPEQVPILEECDDGNSVDGDGCSSGCTHDEPSTEPECGNGIVDEELEETCDDGNLRNGDGCASGCELERCGDGVKQHGEECDDGNLRNNDGCSSTCLPDALCGDGERQGPEECDDGNRSDGDRCSAHCFREPVVSHHCGNGVIDPGESCDDGNRENGDTCSVLCDTGFCGDSVVSGGELCDDGVNATVYNLNGFGCGLLCRLPGYCGDGLRQYGYEQCDDGNRVADDGCDMWCEREATCGNDALEYGEQCDDGNTLAGDDCSATCFLEPPLQCGDRLVDALDGEECDDGNFIPGDGCSPACRRELCGNGVLDVREECETKLLESDAGVDAGALAAEPCTELCRFELYCGDGVVSPGEECDHETADLDCDAECAFAPRCGDGFKDPSEQCDDHNNAALDGCSVSCQSEPACGDGVLNAGEECDDGNVRNGDPCSSKCRLVAPSGGVGSGGNVREIRNGTFTSNVTGWNASDANVTLSFNNQDYQGASNSGSLSVSFSLNTAASALNTTGAEQCVGVDAGQSYSVNAAALIGNTQPASTRSGVLLRFFGTTDCSATVSSSVSLPASAQRGSWTIVGGNFNAPEGARSVLIRLKVTKAGTDANAVVVYDQVQLTGGNSGGGTEPQQPTCGDGLVNTAAEQCDDGNHTDGDGCSVSCTNEAVCGDSVLSPGEPCDDGNVLNGDGCSVTCQIADVCGDGKVTGAEQCDDRNLLNADGCSRVCSLEQTCGDGKVSGGEQCDDGDTTSGDGCSSRCKVEPLCGDGKVQGREQCDDGDLTNDDGCSQLCTIEKTCPLEPVDEACVSSCGDGILQSSLGEECEFAPGSGGSVRCRPNCGFTCDTCLADECKSGPGEQQPLGYPFEACLHATGVAEEGPGKGRPRAELCRELFDCLNLPRTPGCNTDAHLAELLPCFEECPDELAAVAETDDHALQQERVLEPERPIGAGFDLYRCAVANCETACFVECGNAMVEGGEECDDGNSNELDECAACQIVGCGDGRRSGSEQCDPSQPGDEERCNADCTLKLGCGDGVIQTEAPEGAAVSFVPEQCDDSNLGSGDGCSNTCQFEYCGDHIVQPQLETRLWNGQGVPPELTYDPAAPKEECDGAPVNGAACGSDCTLELNCDQCRAQRCSENVPTVCAPNDTACSIPDINDMLACYQETGCFREGVLEHASTAYCLCGDVNEIDCAGVSSFEEVSGACVPEIRKAFTPLRTVLKILLVWTNSDYTAANVNLLMSCERSECADECNWD